MFPSGRCRRRFGPLLALSGQRQRTARFASETEAGPPPLQPPSRPQPRAAAAGLSPHHQKLALWAGGALVVLIVLVILLVSPHRAPLELVPRGETLAQVVDVRRFLNCPLYQMLAAASHPLLAALESKEEKLGISLPRDVATIIDTDESTILVGRFRPDRLRDSFEEAIEAREKEINRNRQAPVRLLIQQAEVEGHTYAFCNQEGVDYAFTAAGSSVVCFGNRWGVRRFLKGRAGVRGRALDDPAFAAAFSPALARRAFLYRLEKPGAKIVASKLKDLLAEAGEGLQAAFFAATIAGTNIDLTIRLAARDTKAAERLEAQLAKATAQVALRKLLGTDAEVRVTRAEAIVVLESLTPLDGFEEIIEKDKKGQGANLVLTLLAS